MSWQTDRVEEKACPCGEGKYSIEYRSDDWGRNDETWKMSCPKCKGRYKLVKEGYTWKGIYEVDYRWSKK